MKRKFDSTPQTSSKILPSKEIHFQHTTNISPFDDENYHQQAFPSFKKPEILGFFSIDGQRNYSHDATMLKYLNVPKDPQLNLNLGYENVITKSDKDEQLIHILRFLSEHKRLSNELPPIDVVCFRGLLRLIMCSPYEQNEDWIVLASKYKGRIYLCHKRTVKKELDLANYTDKQKLFCSYGFKFEQYILSSKFGERDDTSKPVNECEEFCCMYYSKLGNIKLLYGAEMDGIKSNSEINIEETDINRCEFVEVKVKLKETNFHKKRNFLKYKLRNWWCQCFLVNIQNIFVGERNDAGYVSNITELKTNVIPKLSHEYWSPAVCLAFLEKFLSMVNTLLNNLNCSKTVYEFYWSPKQLTKIRYNIHSTENLSFLPQWYIDSD